ncbi:MAG: response regulator transcription factor, partial [Candidatus Latescibacterota bacterium]
MTRILVVDDDPAILTGLEALLTQEGFEVEVAVDGRAALDRFRVHPPDLVLLDLLLPEISGLEVCAAMRREQARVPVLMLTAKGDEEDKVMGLEQGADDYIVKPFGTRELLARIRVALRRRPPRPPRPDSYNLGGLLLDCTRHELVADGSRIPLTAREF